MSFIFNQNLIEIRSVCMFLTYIVLPWSRFLTTIAKFCFLFMLIRAKTK